MSRKHAAERRRFLHQFLDVALTGCGMAAMNGKLQLMGSALAASSDYESLTDYKALVCVFLYGGSDSFNLFVPLDTAQYADYEAARGSLSIDYDSLLASTDGVIGFKPELLDLHGYYQTGELAVVANVGNLIRPVDRSGVLAGTASIPADLFAHNHQQEQWLKGFSSQPTSLVSAGWGGRMADLLQSANTAGGLPPSLSVNGSNYWQPGNLSTPVSVNPLTGPIIPGYIDPNQNNDVRRHASLQQILSLPSSDPLQQFARDSFSRSLASSQLLSNELTNSPNFSTPYNTQNDLAVQLRMVARLIAGREALGMRRQIFFVGMGGWDTHDTQTERLNELAGELNDGLASFQRTIAELAIEEQVTTFTASDFGRTLTINGDGSDHGWGGHYLVMGGAVSGGQLVGEWPNFTVDGPDDSGDKGRVIPRMSVNQYGAALGSWMGLTNSDLLDVFPDLGNFDTQWQQQYGLFS